MAVPFELLAVGAALCYAINGMLAAEIRDRVSVLAFTVLQLAIGAVLTGLIAAFGSGWSTLAAWHLPLLLASGLLGPLITALSMTASIYLLGPRLPVLLFTLNVPFAIMIAFLFLGERVSLTSLSGIGLVVLGIILALRFGAGTPLTDYRGLNGRGVIFGVLAALSQAVGAVVARPVMADMADPFAATAIRTGLAASLLLVVYLVRQTTRLTPLVLDGHVAAAGFLKAVFGVVLGMSLLLTALSQGDVAIVATLSSLTPVLIIPMVWVRTGIAPPFGAWGGALLAVVGCGIISSGA